MLILINCTTLAFLENIEAPKYNPRATERESPIPKRKLNCRVLVAAAVALL